MYKAIVFDLYGTLIDLHTDETRPHMWQTLSLFFSYSGAKYHAEELSRRYFERVKEKLDSATHTQYPDVDILDVFRDLYLYKKVTPSDAVVVETAKLFRVLSIDYIKSYPHMHQLLDLIKQKGYRVILLSNAQRAFTLYEMDLMGITPYFDRVFLSSDAGMCKPEPQFFMKMLEDQNLKATECLFIGNDHLTDIAGASSVGMDSLYLHTNCSQAEVPDLNCKGVFNPGHLKDVMHYLEKLDEPSNN